jgi:predicted small lipoprotein YifL
MRSTLKSLLASLFVLVLAACGRDEPPPPQPPAQPAPTAGQASPSSASPAPGSTSPTGTVVQVEIDTEGDLTAQEHAAIASQRAEGEATTDDDGTDAKGNVRTHMESETALAEETDTPDEHEYEEDDDDRHD